MKKYDHKKIEKYWQNTWEENGVYHAKNPKNSVKKEKYYSLIEFPYPSGDGLHVGHPRPYIGMDVISRKRRMQGYNVLYPIGWDAFGLPTENYAIKTGKDPRIVTKKNTDTFRQQIQSLGVSFDWSREINTTDPKYYKWTQWIFLQFLKKGLAYKAKMNINWCPKDKIGLANEEVINGACERCGTPVEKREKEQWMLAITKYAERLDKDLDTVDYLPKIKLGQRNWIGKSEGLIFSARVKDTDMIIETFNAHFEACYADTFFAIAPDHPLLPKLLEGVREKEAVLKKSEEIVKKRLKFGDDYKDIDGIFTGRYAVDPLGNGDLPIWVASFALKDYGTGIVKCSAHDERDFAFAKKFNIPLKEVIIPKLIDQSNPPRPNKKTVERTAIQAIVTDPKTKKVLMLKWKKFPWTTFITGGVQGNEDKVIAAKREILEETGYKNVKFIKHLGGPIESHFFANHKDENRKAIFYGMIFELENEEKKEIPDEEKEAHEQGNTVEWMTWEELEKDKNLKCSEYFIYKERFFDKTKPVLNGVLLEPLEFKGREISEVRKDIADWLVKKGFAKKKTIFKLRDWVFSRQRYWGEPIPVIDCGKCGLVPVPEKDLPVELPKVKNYQPTDSGESPLANISKWVNVKCPKCKGIASRETDTMPNWAGSSWYYLRYTDVNNKKSFADKKNLKYWTPVDWYNGGNEHTTLHLLYSRFWHKFLYDLKLVPTIEPYMKRTSHGMILGEGGVKMSKSLGNVINPNEIVKTYGADTLRVYEMFMGPFDQAVAWSDEAIIGPRRFLEKVWSIGGKVSDKKSSTSSSQLLHKTIKKVSEDIEAMRFNTAISSLMILVTEMQKANNVSRKDFKIFLQILSPFAPHITEELWKVLGEKKSINLSVWPSFDAKLIKDEEVTIVVQVNGKVRAQFRAEAQITEAEAVKTAEQLPEIAKWIEGKEKRFIFIPRKIVNIVVQP
ncbi:MAG TPA: class I tRNA ligase family protein [Candidatus Paceibacterota bacterium]|jgi:leucyl-tRNA synthetase|nr:class I tRNA ligase family protein [Candidatus Paceibacterota bacterium]